MSNVETITFEVTSQNITDALNARREAEISAHSLNENKSNTLRKLALFANDHVARAFTDAHKSLDFVASKKRVDAMRDVYEIEKIFDLADYYAQSNTVALNHYTRAIALSAVNFTTHEAIFTLDCVRSACSLDEKSRDAKKEKLVVKYQKNVKASTVNAQHRSSLEALKFFEILHERRTSNNERYFVICENDFAKSFFEKIVK